MTELSKMLEEYRAGERGMPTYDELAALLDKPLPVRVFQSAEQNEQLAREAQAIVDAEMRGIGFLVDGVSVHPSRVTVLRPTAAPQVVADEQWVDKLTYDAQVDEWAIEKSNLEREIEALKSRAPVQAQEPANENEWLVANLMKALRPLRDFAYDRGNPYQTDIAPIDWEAFAEAANRMVRDYKPCTPVQPVAVPNGELPTDPIDCAGYLASMAFGNCPADEIGHCVSIISGAIAAPAAQGDAISQQQIAEIIDSYTDQGTKETSIDDAAEAILAAIAAKAAS